MNDILINQLRAELSKTSKTPSPTPTPDPHDSDWEKIGKSLSHTYKNFYQLTRFGVYSYLPMTDATIEPFGGAYMFENSVDDLGYAPGPDDLTYLQGKDESMEMRTFDLVGFHTYQHKRDDMYEVVIKYDIDNWADSRNANIKSLESRFYVFATTPDEWPIKRLYEDEPQLYQLQGWLFRGGGQNNFKMIIGGCNPDVGSELEPIDMFASPWNPPYRMCWSWENTNEEEFGYCIHIHGYGDNKEPEIFPFKIPGVSSSGD